MVLLLRSISSSGRMLVMLLFGFGNHVFLGHDFTPELISRLFQLGFSNKIFRERKGLLMRRVWLKRD
jgi:hypothetical protein